MLPSYAAAAFVDAPVARRGMLLLDNAHGNAFAKEELNTLISRVANRDTPLSSF